MPLDNRQKAINRIRRIKKNHDPVEVLKHLNRYWMECHYPLAHCVLCEAEDRNYTVGDLVKDTIKKAKEAKRGKESSVDG